MDSNAASFIGDIPHSYDRGLGPVIFEDYAADMAARVAAFRPLQVLELAAGTGILTRRLRDALDAKTPLIATDLNPPMLAVARAKFQPGEAIAFQTADAMALPFPDASFDAIVCQFGIMFFPDKVVSLKEARRVLKPGGRYLFSVWDAHRHNRFAVIAGEVVASFFADQPPTFMTVPFSYHSLDVVKESLDQAGFGRVDIAILPHEKTLENSEDFAQGIVFGNPLVDQIRARGQDPAAVKAAVAAGFRREFGADPGRLRLQTIVFEARHDR